MATFTLRRINMRKVKWLSFITIVLVLLAGCSSEPKNTPDEVIDQLEQAIADNKADALMEIATSMDKMYTLTKEDAQGWIDFFRENEEELERELERLDVMATGQSPDDDSVSEIRPLFLTYTEGKWGGRGEYKIGIQPNYFRVYTNLKDTHIYLDDNLVGVALKDNFTKVVGPLSPGEYTMRAEYQAESESYSSEEISFSVPYPYYYEINIDLRVAAEKIRFDSNYEDADLYLNGKDSGMTIAEANEQGLLLATDGSVSAQAKFMQNGVLLESDSVLIKGHDDYYYLELPAEYVYVDTTISGGTLYADGQDTGFELNDQRENQYGPLEADTYVSLHAEIDSPWGRLSSYEENVYVGKDAHNYSYLPFIAYGNDEVLRSIEASLDQFIRSGFEAIYEYDSHLLQNVTEETRYYAFDTLLSSIYSRDATLTDFMVDAWYAQLSGSIHDATVESLSIDPIYLIVHYSHPTFYSFYGDEYAKEYVAYRIAMDYNVNTEQWEVSSITWE